MFGRAGRSGDILSLPTNESGRVIRLTYYAQLSTNDFKLMSKLPTAEMFMKVATQPDAAISLPRSISNTCDTYKAHEVIDLDAIRKNDSRNQSDMCCKVTDKNPLCCGTSLRCKQIILIVTFLVVVPLLVFFAFAIVPIKNQSKPIKPLSNEPATTSGVIKVLLLGTDQMRIICVVKLYSYFAPSIESADSNVHFRRLCCRYPLQKKRAYLENRSAATAVLHEYCCKWQVRREDVRVKIEVGENTEGGGS